MGASDARQPAEVAGDRLTPATVPGHWHLSGLPDHDGRVWYAHTFETAAQAAEEAAFLRFEGVDYEARVWLNDAYLGSHTGYFEAFEFQVDAQLRPGSNTLWVQVNAPREAAGTVWPDRKTLIKGIFAHHDCRPGAWHPRFGQDGNTGGIWGAVALEWRPRTHLSGMHAVTHLVGEPGEAPSSATVVVTAELAGPGDAGLPDAVLELWDPEGVRVASAAAVAHGRVLHAGLSLDSPRLWWSWEHGEQPLYTLVLRAGGDALHQTLAFRSVVQAGDTWLLNGKRLFLRGTNIIPAQYLAEYSAALIDTDVRLMREAGLNIVRVHAHVNREAFYAACDRAGLMVWQDFALQWSYDPSPTFAAEACRQIRAMVTQLRAHPSIVAWCCHNEPAGQELTLDPLLAQAVLAEDASRIVRTHSDFSEHPYPGWYEGQRQTFAALPGAPLITEFGAQALPDPEALAEMLEPEALWPPDWTRWAYHDFQYEQTFWIAEVAPGASLAEFVRASQHYQAELLHDAIDHYRRARFAPITGVFQFMFVDGWPSITWSVLDHRRRPKLGYHVLKTVMAPLYLSLRLPTRRHRAGTPLPLDLVLINDLHHGHVGLVVSVAVRDEAGQVLRAWEPLTVAIGPDALLDLAPRLKGLLATDTGWRGACVVEATASLNGVTLCRSTRPLLFDVLPSGLAEFKTVEMPATPLPAVEAGERP